MLMPCSTFVSESGTYTCKTCGFLKSHHGYPTLGSHGHIRAAAENLMEALNGGGNHTTEAEHELALHVADFFGSLRGIPPPARNARSVPPQAETESVPSYRRPAEYCVGPTIEFMPACDTHIRYPLSSPCPHCGGTHVLSDTELPEDYFDD